MLKKEILCAVDFSEPSMDALKWSIELARKDHATITIMYCYRLIASFDDEQMRDLKKNIELEAKRKFQKFETAYLHGLDVQYSFITEVGFYHFRIEMFLRHNPVALVVIGSSIAQNFDENKHLGFGQFLKNAKVPVVVVPLLEGRDAEVQA